MAAINQVVTEKYAIYNGDCVEGMAALPDNSIHFSVYSPPFGGMQYMYSSDPADLSNSKDYKEFFDHYEFIVKEIHRLTLPGRITAVHCTDILKSMGEDPWVVDFPGDIIRCHESNGWKHVGRFHIWKEPLTVRNRTMVKSLHHATLVEDSTQVSLAHSDYLLIFRRSGKNPIPVAHPRGLLEYAGAGNGEDQANPSNGIPEDILKWKGHDGNQINNEYSQWIWRQYASSNWYDIRPDRTLGTGASLYSANKADKDEPDEKHMHPLQLDVIERGVVLFSNPGETVLTPFLGVGSEVYGAVKNGRRGVGWELKTAYFNQAIENMQSLEKETAAPQKSTTKERSLFDAECAV